MTVSSSILTDPRKRGRVANLSGLAHSHLPQPPDPLASLSALIAAPDSEFRRSVRVSTQITRGDLKQLLMAGPFSESDPNLRHFLTTLASNGCLTKGFVNAAAQIVKEIEESPRGLDEKRRALTVMTYAVADVPFAPSEVEPFAKLITTLFPLNSYRTGSYAFLTARSLIEAGVPCSRVVDFVCARVAQYPVGRVGECFFAETDCLEGKNPGAAKALMEVSKRGFFGFRDFFKKLNACPTGKAIRAMSKVTEGYGRQDRLASAIGVSLRLLNLRPTGENILHVGAELRALPLNSEVSELAACIERFLSRFCEPREIDHLTLARSVCVAPNADRKLFAVTSVLDDLVVALERPLTLAEGKAWLIPLADLSEPARAGRTLAAVIRRLPPKGPEEAARYGRLAADVAAAYASCLDAGTKAISGDAAAAWVGSFTQLPSEPELRRMLLLLRADVELPKVERMAIERGMTQLALIAGSKLTPALVEKCREHFRRLGSSTSAEYAASVIGETLPRVFLSHGELESDDIDIVVTYAIEKFPDYRERRDGIERELM